MPFTVYFVALLFHCLTSAELNSTEPYYSTPRSLLWEAGLQIYLDTSFLFLHQSMFLNKAPSWKKPLLCVWSFTCNLWQHAHTNADTCWDPNMPFGITHTHENKTHRHTHTAFSNAVPQIHYSVEYWESKPWPLCSASPGSFHTLAWYKSKWEPNSVRLHLLWPCVVVNNGADSQDRAGCRASCWLELQHLSSVLQFLWYSPVFLLCHVDINMQANTRAHTHCTVCFILSRNRRHTHTVHTQLL